MDPVYWLLMGMFDGLKLIFVFIANFLGAGWTMYSGTLWADPFYTIGFFLGLLILVVSFLRMVVFDGWWW